VTHAYVADGSSGLQVIDVSNSTTPVVVGAADTPGFAVDVTVSGTHAYVADRASGLQVIDISDPTAPVVVGSVDTPDDARGVSILGAHAYVADGISGLQVIDVSDPTAPVVVGSVDTPRIFFSGHNSVRDARVCGGVIRGSSCDRYQRSCRASRCQLREYACFGRDGSRWVYLCD